MTRIERETVIIWNDQEKEATITTRSPTTKRRMEAKGYVFNEMPQNSGLWRSSAPKGRVFPKVFARKTSTRKAFPSKKGHPEPFSEILD